MLGGLSVPLRWGVVVPPDDYDHWAPEPEEGAEADSDASTSERKSQATDDGGDELDEWAEWVAEWQGEPEPRFDVPRTGGVIPHSPAAG